MSDSLRPHESQHARPPCPSPTPGVYSNSCPSSQWCHPAISSSVVPFSSCPQSLPASGSFPMSMRWPKYWSFSFSISPSNEHPGLISFRMEVTVKWGRPLLVSWTPVCYIIFHGWTVPKGWTLSAVSLRLFGLLISSPPVWSGCGEYLAMPLFQILKPRQMSLISHNTHFSKSRNGLRVLDPWLPWWLRW